MIIFQNFVDCALGCRAVTVQGGTLFAGDGGSHIGKSLGKGVVVILFAGTNLLVKPTHCVSASSFVRYQLCIDSAVLHQLLVRSALRNPSAVKNNDLVTVADR